MSPLRRALFEHHVPTPERFSRGEAALMPALMRWLIATGRLGSHTTVAYELALLGRRVDLALLSRHGMATAFELKLGSVQRVIEQASYNRASFHRSWVVTGNRPQEQSLAWANQHGVGVVVVQRDLVKPVLPPVVGAPNAVALARLRRVIRDRGEVFVG